MILRLDFERLRTLDEVRAFMEGNPAVDFRLVERDEAYELVRRVLVRFGYAGLDKAGKGLVKRFLGKATGFSRAQLTRLIGQLISSKSGSYAPASERVVLEHAGERTERWSSQP